MNDDTVDAKLLGKRIRFLRRSRHWTQAELAEKVGIRTGPMNYLENGHHLPSLPVLCRLVDIFRISMDELLGQPQRCVVREDAPPYHGIVRQSEEIKIAAAGEYLADLALLVRFDPVKEPLQETDLLRIERILDAFLALEDICGVQKQAHIPLQLRLPARESGFERLADQVRSLLGISDAVISDYLELLENAGLRIVFLPLSRQVESVSFYDRANANAFFFINSAELNVERQLFRLCYELGRIYLYNGGMGSSRRIGSLDAEHAARRLAALFLMPAEAVIASVQQVGVSPQEWTWDMLMRLKHRLGVSAETFLYRLEELELIAKPVRNELKHQIYAHYTAHNYTEPDSSRRILTPNGRLGDLLLSAGIKKPDHPELPGIRKTLEAQKIIMP